MGVREVCSDHCVRMVASVERMSTRVKFVIPSCACDAMASCPDDAKKNVEARRAAVWAAQREMGMVPRGDSHLTEQFAQGTCDPEYCSAAVVAKELVMVHFIHTETLYGQIIEDVMRHVARWFHDDWHLTWTDAWTIVRRYVPSMLKFHCMRMAGMTVNTSVAIPEHEYRIPGP